MSTRNLKFYDIPHRLTLFCACIVANILNYLVAITKGKLKQLPLAVKAVTKLCCEKLARS